MRYYDAVEDSNCRGFIDLAEVESVQPVKGFPGTSKKSEDNSIFEVFIFHPVWAKCNTIVHCLPEA